MYYFDFVRQIQHLKLMSKSERIQIIYLKFLYEKPAINFVKPRYAHIFRKFDVGSKKHLGNQAFNVHGVLMMQRLGAPSQLD